jgi:hypothetical protein
MTQIAVLWPSCSLPFSLRSLDIPALLKSWQKHYPCAMTAGIIILLQHSLLPGGIILQGVLLLLQGHEGSMSVFACHYG